MVTAVTWCPGSRGHLAQEIRAEASSNGSDVRGAGLTQHKKSTPIAYGFRHNGAITSTLTPHQISRWSE